MEGSSVLYEFPGASSMVMAKIQKLPGLPLQSWQCRRWTGEIHQEQVKEVANQGNGYHAMVMVTDHNLPEQESNGIKPRKTCWLLLTKIRLYFIVLSIHTHLTLCFLIFLIISLLMCIPFFSIHNQDEC